MAKKSVKINIVITRVTLGRRNILLGHQIQNSYGAHLANLDWL